MVAQIMKFGLLSFFSFSLMSCSNREAGKIICKARNCKIYSNTGLLIPAKIYLENRSQKDDSGKLSYLIIFNDSLNFKKNLLEEEGPDVLIVYPCRNLLAMPNLFRGSFKSLNENCIYQPVKKIDEVGIVDNRALYSNPPIKYAHFKGDKVIFNTYGPLKQFGYSIILEIGK